LAERAVRRYQLKRRAERQAETRARIVEATIVAHESGDPANRSISAIARRAGVSRLTVYRHFPDEVSLLTACTSLYGERHPLPDLSLLRPIVDPRVRLTAGLVALYGYYADNERMLASGAAAFATHPALLEAMRPWFASLEELALILAEGWPVDAGPGSLVAGAIGHAISLTTWLSLRREQGLANGQAITLMASLVDAAVAASPRATDVPPIGPASSIKRERVKIQS
jgi:AcrR family transcriptional regulator